MIINFIYICICQVTCEPRCIMSLIYIWKARFTTVLYIHDISCSRATTQVLLMFPDSGSLREYHAYHHVYYNTNLSWEIIVRLRSSSKLHPFWPMNMFQNSIRGHVNWNLRLIILLTRMWTRGSTTLSIAWSHHHHHHYYYCYYLELGSMEGVRRRHTYASMYILLLHMKSLQLREKWAS